MARTKVNQYSVSQSKLLTVLCFQIEIVIPNRNPEGCKSPPLDFLRFIWYLPFEHRHTNRMGRYHPSILPYSAKEEGATVKDKIYGAYLWF